MLGLALQRLPDLPDPHLERRVADKNIRPPRVEQFLLRHQLAGVLDKIEEHAVRLRR